jgi:hypothetical protein
MALATEHPEFFRVRNDPNQKRVALLSRYVLDYQAIPDGHEKRLPLDPSSPNKLMELAIKLHDKQLERKNGWKNFIPIIIPMVVALIAASPAMSAAIINTTKPIVFHPPLPLPPTLPPRHASPPPDPRPRPPPIAYPAPKIIKRKPGDGDSLPPPVYM